MLDFYREVNEEEEVIWGFLELPLKLKTLKGYQQIHSCFLFHQHICGLHWLKYLVNLGVNLILDFKVFGFYVWVNLTQRNLNQLIADLNQLQLDVFGIHNEQIFQIDLVQVFFTGLYLKL